MCVVAPPGDGNVSVPADATGTGKVGDGVLCRWVGIPGTKQAFDNAVRAQEPGDTIGDGTFAGSGEGPGSVGPIAPAVPLSKASLPVLSEL